MGWFDNFFGEEEEIKVNTTDNTSIDFDSGEVKIEPTPAVSWSTMPIGSTGSIGPTYPTGGYTGTVGGWSGSFPVSKIIFKSESQTQEQIDRYLSEQLRPENNVFEQYLKAHDYKKF